MKVVVLALAEVVFHLVCLQGETAETQSSGYILCNLEDVLEQRWHCKFNLFQILYGIFSRGTNSSL